MVVKIKQDIFKAIKEMLMGIKKKINLYVMALLYGLAGGNHFLNPANYYEIIPPYIGNEILVNNLAGIAELLLAAMLLIPSLRKLACFGIIAMLIAFLPAHIYMIQANCSGSFCLPEWLLWIRLLLLQPLLILWAWWNRK